MVLNTYDWTPGAIVALKRRTQLFHAERVRFWDFGVSDVSVGVQLAVWVMNNIRRPIMYMITAVGEKLARVLLYFGRNFGITQM